jgi:hypothetical protein
MVGTIVTSKKGKGKKASVVFASNAGMIKVIFHHNNRYVWLKSSEVVVAG